MRPQVARVVNTGLALVHAGELVFPAVDSVAAAEIAAADDRTVVNYYFAVEVEVRGAPDGAKSARSTAEDLLASLARSIDNIA
jgi:hypothetical protein